MARHWQEEHFKVFGFRSDWIKLAKKTARTTRKWISKNLMKKLRMPFQDLLTTTADLTNATFAGKSFPIKFLYSSTKTITF